MILLLELSFKALITAYVIVGGLSVILILLLLFIFTSQHPPKRKQSLTDSIQEGIDETNVDFDLKHPRAHFECPYSHESCEHMNTLTMKPLIKCRDCERSQTKN